ncbi:hypothetical protein CPS_2415 [Colwellia psychrerythraea 34H]|uniref:Uncharacterized protein n=1 Tax=Colwellia psychrerythraea (strain 34H / ATCC BAA-681) TaxID=167879 RepID=Q481Y7_COLP3|nr:hypothetical protein CPS_2415 [Colwellia psychrerythraea 34H]
MPSFFWFVHFIAMPCNVFCLVNKVISPLSFIIGDKGMC